jgi:hypothetical protein
MEPGTLTVPLRVSICSRSSLSVVSDIPVNANVRTTASGPSSTRNETTVVMGEAGSSRKSTFAER